MDGLQIFLSLLKKYQSVMMKPDPCPKEFWARYGECKTCNDMRMPLLANVIFTCR